jgi:hypothetical protein
MNDTRAGSAGGVPVRARRPRSTPSAGLPGEELSAEDRLRELEARLARVEGGPGYRERGRTLLHRVMPPEASRHFRNAGREELLGIRSIVDFWISRIDDAERRSAPEANGRERIDVS